MIERVPTIILVAIGGLLGAVARYIVSSMLSDVKPSFLPIPYGTLAVNVIGSLLLGIIFTMAQMEMIGEWYPLIATGFMGSFTTMSSFAVETMNLHADHSLNIALANFMIMMILVMVGAYTGRALAILLFKESMIG